MNFIKALGAGSLRFPCGDKWYILRVALARDTFIQLAADLGLAASATTSEIEKQLHFRFQRLYHKPPDDLTDAEATEWDCLLKYIDFAAYQDENPLPENRIGILAGVDANEVSVHWNGIGVKTYDSRHVPTTLLTSAIGWVVHALFQRAPGGDEKWVTAWVEPPYKTDEQVVSEDIAAPTAVSLDAVPDADWPRI